MDQPTVLLVSDDVEFSRKVAGRWQHEPNSPAFTLMSGDLCRDLRAENFDLAIVGNLRPELLAEAVKTLEATGCPAIFAGDKPQLPQHRHIMVLPQSDGWLDALVLIVAASLGQCEALRRARALEHSNLQLERQAALGRYILEMRHTLNNSLTSILGNAELMLLEPAMNAPASRAQVDTIRNMAVRMHEILQRFSSIDKELSVLERQPEAAVVGRGHAAATGS